ncbi:MAG TPA: glycosyltransferase [Acidimicrobiales bacterium]|nr:glycosyltransferase [Acidimicrobiales bacterium]
MGGIHQFVPLLHVGDAVGQHTLDLRRLLTESGVDAQIYVELDDPDTVHLTRPAGSYPDHAARGDLLVYQFATASDLAPWLAARPERLVVNYHNITPAELFAPWDNGLGRHQVRAKEELVMLARRATLGVGVSEYNRRDLVAAGYQETAVVPPIVRFATGAPSSAPPEADGRGAARWLAVGRLAPNKALEDTLQALLVYRMRHDPKATLTVVGRPAIPVYATAVRRFAADLGLGDAVRFTGRLEDAGLVAAYRSSDVLVITSEHEGFCLPALEAMANDLPVVAYAEGALPEVLGDAADLLSTKDPLVVADAVHRLAADPAWRAARVAAGRRRLPELRLDQAGPRLVELLRRVREG